ncbi:MAG: hypothetical protein WEE51_01130, partial [Pirellulaceae bacterium]
PMMADEQLLVILRDLLAKSRKNQVLWVRSAKEKDCFELYLAPEIQIAISFESPMAMSDFIGVAVHTEGRESIYMTREDGDDDYPFLLALYQEAHRRATRWDDTLEKINSAIHVEGVIGINPNDSYAH